MSDNIHIIHKGVIPYGTMLATQRRHFDMLVSYRRRLEPAPDEYIFTLQHSPVITLGRHADPHNLLVPADTLAARGIDIVNIDRGGDITYHGPGQLIVYPIIDIDKHRLGIRDYINLLEQAVIDTVALYGITAGRIEGATGVWIEPDTERARKICAIGVRCSHFITMHGLALNVTTDLTPFSLINPCGFTDRGVTSIARETATTPDIDTVARQLAQHLTTLLTNS